MQTPTRFHVVDAAFATDGGSIYLALRTEAGESHGLLLTQHSIPAMPDDPKLRGRLYLDGALVEQRSDAERALIEGLRRAPIVVESETPTAKPFPQPHLVVGDDIKAFLERVAEGPAAATSHLVCELIAFVESDEYLKFAG